MKNYRVCGGITMAVTFYIANNEDDICMETNYLNFDEEIQNYLIETRNRTLPRSIPLLELDPYLHLKIYNKDEILELIEIGKLITSEYKEEKKIKDFADELIKFCVTSIERNIGIIAAGD